MFPGRPFPNQRDPYELAPEAYVAAGRRQGWEDGQSAGYDEGWTDGWNAAVNQANPIIEKQKQEFIAERLDANRTSLVGRAFQETVEDLINQNPETKALILGIFKQAYIRNSDLWLRQGSLKILPHQEPSYLVSAPVTGRFIMEALKI